MNINIRFWYSQSRDNTSKELYKDIGNFIEIVNKLIKENLFK